MPETAENVRAPPGHHYFAPNWEFSYSERGEDLNIARVNDEYREVRHHEYSWWQTHVSGWKQEGGPVRLRAHDELEPTEYDQDHVQGIGVDVPAGIQNAAQALVNEGLAHERHEHLPAGGEMWPSSIRRGILADRVKGRIDR